MPAQGGTKRKGATGAVAGFGRKPQHMVPAAGQSPRAGGNGRREAVLDRLAWQITELRASLDKIAVANAAMAAELN